MYLWRFRLNVHAFAERRSTLALFLSNFSMAPLRAHAKRWADRTVTSHEHAVEEEGQADDRMAVSGLAQQYSNSSVEYSAWDYSRVSIVHGPAFQSTDELKLLPCPRSILFWQERQQVSGCCRVGEHSIAMQLWESMKEARSRVQCK